MNWDALGALAEMVGAGAVVLSLLYLAMQVRESLRQARFDATRELSTRIADASLAVAQSRDVAKMFLHGASKFEDLDEVDQVRFRGLMNALFRGFEQQFLLWRAGAIDQEGWHTVEGIIHDFTTLPGVREYLVHRAPWYSRAFREYLQDREGIAYGDERVGMAEDYVDVPQVDEGSA